MVYTITLNPSIDHYIFSDREIIPNCTNRAAKTVNLCGGKGINVSIACKSLGVPSVCTGFCGGFTGVELQRQLYGMGIDHNFTEIKADTRINTKIVKDGKVTEINAEAPYISEEEIKGLHSIISDIRCGDTAVLSGSVPKIKGLLTSILEAIKNTGARFIADVSGPAFDECLEYRPYLIKPNRTELAEYFKHDEQSMDIPAYSQKLLPYAQNIIVSDGERGAYHVNNKGVRYLPVTDAGYSVKNTTGAGDCMIAGYLYGEQTGIDPFICAVSAGSASAYCEGLFEKNVFENVIKQYLAV